MEVFFLIIGGLVILGILNAIGAIQEIFNLIAMCLFAGGAAALISWICNGDSGFWFGIGLWIGAGLYALLCVGRIINPEITITVYTDGSSSESNERLNGIVGIIVLIIVIIVLLTK